MTDASEERVAAFVALMREQDRSLRAFTYRLVGGDVEDVLQAAYLAAFRAMPEFRGDSSMTSWLHRIVYTTAINHLRSRRRRIRYDQFGAVAESGGDFAVSLPGRLDLVGALSRLPVDQRAALLLVDGQGFSYDDAAAVLGVSAGTVASRLNRARLRVRATLNSERAG
jgi:RNA polymerase sigma-70 factor (ECF subfamily)